MTQVKHGRRKTLNGGPQTTLLVGTLMHVSGYLGVWAVLTRRAGFANSPLWQTSVGLGVWRSSVAPPKVNLLI